MGDILIYIPPNKIDYYCRPPLSSVRLQAQKIPGCRVGAAIVHEGILRKKNIYSGGWDIDKEEWERHHSYKRIEDIIDHIHDIKKSKTYEDARRSLHCHGVFKYKSIKCRDVDDLERLFDYMVSMIHSITREGFDFSLTKDMPAAFVDRFGSVIKSGQASHRFSIAKLCAPEKPVPLYIRGVHSIYFNKCRCPRTTAFDGFVEIVSKVAKKSDGFVADVQI